MAMKNLRPPMGHRAWLLAPVLALLFFARVGTANAADACVSTGSGLWNTAGTWSSCGGTIPTSDDSVTILTGHIVTVDTAAVADTVTINANAGAGGNGITINSGQSLTVTNAVTLSIPTAATTNLTVGNGALAAGSIAIPGSGSAGRFATVSVIGGTVTVSGSVTFSGTAAQARYISTGASLTTIGGNFGSGGTLTTTGTGTFNFNGSVAQTMGAYITYNSVQINNSNGGVAYTGTTTIAALLVNAGTLDTGAVTAIVSGATTVNGTLLISSVTGSKTFGDLTIANGGTMSFTAAEGVVMNGNLVVNGTGTISASTTTGTWTFQKVGGGTISGTASSIGTMTAATFTTAYALSIPATIPTLTATGVTFTNNSTLTVATSLAGTGQLTQGTGSVLNIGGTSAITALDASASLNEVHYTSTAANQTIKAPVSAYHHLFIEKTGRVGTLAAATTVNGNLSVTAGTLADGGFQITGNASGALSLAAGTTLTLGTTTAATSFPTSFTAVNTSLNATSTVNYNSNLAQTLSNVPAYGNLTTTATAAVTKTAAGALTVNGNLTNGTNNTLADGGFTITVKGNGTMTGSQTGSGKILFAGGAAAHSVIGNISNAELDDVNGALLTGATTIGGTLTLTTGTWDMNSRTQTVSGATTIAGTLLFSSISSTRTFGDIVVNSGGTMSFTALAGLTVNGNLTVNGTGAISGTTGTWTFQKAGGGSIGGTAASLTIAGGTTFATAYSIPSPFTVNTFTVNAGVNETNIGTLTINTALAGTGTLTQSPNTVLNLGGTATVTTLDASANPNAVHYTSTTSGQTMKTATYYNLFIEKSAQAANVSGTTNVLGNLTVTSGVLSLGAGVLAVSGTTDIFGIIRDINNSGSATFGGLITVYAGGSWDGNAAEACDFNFMNGLSFSGTSFVSGGGLFTFLTNNQAITGSSSVSVKNLVVTGIQLTNSSSAPLVVATALSGTGELIQDANAVLNIGGTSTIATLTATASGNTVNYNGAAAQTVKATAYRTLDVSGNTNGNVNIAADATANAALALGGTVFSTGSSKMIVAPGGTLSRTTGYIDGNLQKNVPTGAPALTFEVGSGPGYAPIGLSFGTVTVPGDLVASTTTGDHPSIASSHLDASKTANRFYTVTNTGVGFDAYDAVFTFLPADVDGAATTTDFVLAKFDAGTWSRPTLGTVTATSVTGTGLTSFSDFQIGEADVVTVAAVDTTHADGTFGAGEVIDITVRFSDIVSVAGGTPFLALNSGGTAVYLSGSGTDTLTFRYTVSSGESSADLDYPSVSALSLNGSTIRDGGGGNADLTLPGVGTFSSAHAIVIVAPSGGGGGGGGSHGTITVVKKVINDEGGTKAVADFPLYVNGTPMMSGVSTTFSTGGIYSVTETNDAGYARRFSGDCDANGQMNLNPGENKTCILTNDDVAAVPAGTPAIRIAMTASPTSLPANGGGVTYSETVTNAGTVALSAVAVTNDTCGPVRFVSGDADRDAKLEPGETWTYVCSADLGETTTNVAVATAEAAGVIARHSAAVTVVVGERPVQPYGAAEARATALTIDIDKGLVAPGNGDPLHCTSATLIKLPSDDDPDTQMDSTVYYCGIDGNRHVFPDVGTYFSWYEDFSTVRIVSAETLAAVPLDGNVTYRPGSRLLKIMSDPKVYAVAKGGVLRWVTTEEVARTLYGPDWSRMVSDVAVSIFSSGYAFGDPITLAEAIPAHASPMASACSSTTFFTAFLAPGSTDLEVRPLQELLKCLGHFPADVDVTGFFGDVTEDAVRKFQSANGIAPVGYVGPATRSALNRY